MKARSVQALRLVGSSTSRALPTAFYRPALPLAPRALSHRAFSSSAPRCEVTALSSKLAEELTFEEQAASEQPAEPEWLQDFKKEGVWAIEDKLGSDEMVLRRTYGKETIQIVFSISDLSADPEEVAANEEPVEGESEEPSELSIPIETAITVTKEGKGGLTIDAVAQDGFFTINGVSFYPDAKLAVGVSSEDDWKRSGLYVGPEFENLDEALQAEFENFLEERAINANLALTIPDLAEFKEQKEYVNWLKSVKDFVEA